MKYFTYFLLIFLLISCQEEKKQLFEKTSPESTGIHFANIIQESETENILSYEYFYNGGGVAVGDFNNDGFQDIYFAGNQVENKLYLNKGNRNGEPLTFEDVTQKAGVGGRKNGWKTGVCVVDVNADGWLDLYVCYSGLKIDSLRKNQLFINNHNLTFTEKAEEYGLADSGYSTQATFFDYDLDGDLDCFLINHNLAGYQRKEANVMRNALDYNAGDKLFRNSPPPPDGGVNHPVFVDVSQEADIKGNPLGFGLGVSINDINKDGYPDIYVSNDYVEDDYLYINQRNGKFKDELREHLAHTSYSAMGVDIADMNNDGLADIFTLDMLPEDNARQKLLVWADNWNVHQAQLQNGFWHSNMRNMLQINQGDGHFSEIGQLAGISNTDWSWGALLADYDLDGYKDIFISNGLGKDLTNADFIKYYDDAATAHKPLLEHLKQMTTSKTRNYIFKNKRDLTFQNQQKAWGFNDETTASGAIYADLDNDGDLEIITNNLNETARIYKNMLQETSPQKFVKIHLKGLDKNPFGIGAKIEVKDDSTTQTQEVSLTHGFQSSFVGDLLFGIKSKNYQAKITWANGKSQTLKLSEKSPSLLEFDEKNAVSVIQNPTIASPIFTISENPLYTHQQKYINNFDNQILLPNHYSYAGPKMAVGDLNNDKQEELIICGTNVETGVILEKKGEKFTSRKIGNKPQNNQDVLIADFNGDSYKDIYFVNGAYENASYDFQNDELWLNNKNDTFTQTPLADAINSISGKVLDVDKDGDLDIFLGGYIKPMRYPYAEESFLLINDGKANFTKTSLGKLGLITDEVIIDIDKDGYQDVIVLGEWMTPTVLKNQHGKLVIDKNKMTDNLAGWWNRIEKADLDNDGDEDLVLGNLGQNTQIKATEREPATLIYDDFDGNGSIDFFMSYFIQGKSYPAYSRDEVLEQIPSLRKKFTSYKAYSTATIEDIFEPTALEKAQKKTISELKTIILENKNGQFIVHQLPIEAQYSPVYAILLFDYNNDGKKDILLAGNNDKFRLRIGKVSANYGQLFKNNGNFNFTYVPQKESGFQLTGNVRDIKQFQNQLLFGINNQNLVHYFIK